VARRLAPARLLALARRPDRRWRLALAIAGLPPVGLSVATWLDLITGCGRFAASCTPPMDLAPIAIQPVLFGILVAIPAAAAATAFASAVALAVAVPAGMVLALGSLPGSAEGRVVYAIVCAAAWAAGLVAGVIGVRRHDDGGGASSGAPSAPSAPSTPGA
jgi:hypothetical protein